jgi:transposase
MEPGTDRNQVRNWKPYPAELKERSVRMVLDHRGEYPTESAAIRSVATKMGMHWDTLKNWVRQSETDRGVRPGISTDERERLRELEREVRELRRANEILKTASAFFARELDPRLPR